MVALAGVVRAADSLATAWLVATLADGRFALIAIEESRRDVYCNPHQTAGVQALVDELDPSGVVTVHGRSIVPLGQAYVVDPNAMEVSRREAFHVRPGAWRWT